MAGIPEPESSRALFTLAGGLEVATGQTALEAVGRAKQASVLFDEIVLECGLHVVELRTRTVPAMVRRRPPASISPELLEDSRVVRSGTKAGIAIRVAEGKIELYMGTNLPRLPDASYFEDEVAYRYVSEYHTGLLDELATLGANWVRVVSIDRQADTPELRAQELAVLEPAASDRDFNFIELDPDQARELSEQIASALEGEPHPDPHDSPVDPPATPAETMLAEDLAEAVQIANRLQAVPVLSGAFTQVAEARGVPVGLPGAESLGFLVPNFSVLPWDAIARFRDHPGAVEARGRLREFETEAAVREAHGSPDFIRQTGRAVSDGLLAAVKDLSPSLPEDLRSPLVGSGVGLIPIVGQFASLAVSMGDVISALRAHQNFEGSWVAAVFELREAAADATLDW